ncbi:integrase core domain protein [Collimonas arenae]|uniref:Integrase core domain protein n=1 Tax=Collimonas arenae TaxID=279058 RepID=A0A127QMX6_9BURK|nr:DDE-type integrase/transposase/recombinase [Collimonas arenae]AMP01546.1 integrase core domain protein [Collimonas arenae]AMP11440.1 integrase core domain protein [Collimonas arenae]
MALFAFATGLTLRRGEQLLEFRRHLPNGQVQFEDPLTGRIYAWSMAKMYRDINSGELVIFRGDGMPPATAENDDSPKPLPLLPSLESLPAKHRKGLERRLDYINSCKKQGQTRGCRRQLQRLIQKIAERRQESPPSASSVMQWWRTLDQNDACPASLVSGNLHRKRSRGLPESIIAIIRKILRKEYFTRKRYPLTRAHILINNTLQNLRGSDAKTSEISLSTARRYANEVGPYFKDVARYGPAYARNKWRYSLEGTVTHRVLERVEIDHTQLDMVVICDRSGLPLGRPTITVVIDAHSGYVLSFFISFWGTGLGPSLNAIKIGIMPKEDYCNGPTVLSNPWLGYGIFELIVVDNGLEFHSPQFQLAAWHLNADIQYCAVRQPWLKPSVERVLGTLELYLPAEGHVHKPLSNYLPPNPRETASITFSQLCYGLLKCFVDILPMEPNNRTLIEPFEVFRDGFERLPPPLLPSSFNEISLISAMSKTMSVGNEGVVFMYLRYNSVELQNLRRRTAHTFKTLIKFQPEDLNSIYVQDPTTKMWLLVPSCQPEYTYQLSIVQHHAIRKQLKGQLDSRNTAENLIRAKIDLIEMWADFLRGNRGKKNIQAAQKFGTLTSAQTLTGEAFPMVIPRESTLIVPEDIVIPSREIPQFSSFQLD